MGARKRMQAASTHVRHRQICRSVIVMLTAEGNIVKSNLLPIETMAICSSVTDISWSGREFNPVHM